MWTKGGLRPFTNGLIPTIYRDVVFGGSYTFLRLEYQHYFQTTPQYQWLGNLGAAAIATIISGPFNLARNVQYGTSSLQTAPTTKEVLRELWKEVRALPSWNQKWHHVQNRLRIGWGTMRVGVGMALGHYVYDECFLWYQGHTKDIERVEERLHLIPARRSTLVTPLVNDDDNDDDDNDDDDSKEEQ
mmetsp:Transcript_17742/g.30142  ORF Transcript_17742/g.30142 Transcript_17742/m.30142 type:complete len:187 (+) Transcript_17742:1-561(+)